MKRFDVLEHTETDEQQIDDVRYNINSLPLSGWLFARKVRGHWAIENTLHWCLDVTFREDECRARERNLARLKRFAITLWAWGDRNRCGCVKSRQRNAARMRRWRRR